MPNTHIANFLRTGVLHDDVLGSSNADIAAALADPSLAIVLVHSEQRAKDFKKVGRLRDFRRHLLDAIDALVERGRAAGTLDDFGAAVARLYGASLLEWAGGRRGDWLIGGGDVPESVRRSGVEGFAAGRFDVVQGIRPQRVLRLLQAPEASAVDLDPWLKNAVGSALRSALSQLHPAGQPGLHARIRACAVMACASLDEDAGPGDRRAILDAAGMSADDLARITSELAGEGGVPTIFAAAGREPRFEELGRNAEFRSAADRLGVPVNPEEIRMRSALEQELPQVVDPWIRMVYRAAIGSGPSEGNAIAVLKAAGIDRRQRSVVLAKVLEGPMARDPEARSVFAAEMQFVPAGLRLRTFRALFEAIHLGDDADAVREIERSPVIKWFREARATYVRDAAEFARQDRAGDLLELLSATLRMPSPPRALAALQADMDQIVQDELRRSAEQKGRLWLYDFIRRCSDAMSAPESWDGGTRVLAADDQRFVVELVAASKGASNPGQAGAWFEREIAPARQFRLIEAAHGCGIVKRDDFRRAVDAAARRLLADVAQGSFTPDDRAKLESLVRRCAGHVLGEASGSAPAWRVLEAFRRLDPHEMLAASSISVVAFPGRRRRSAPVGFRAAALFAAAAGLVLVPVGAALFAAAPALPASRPVAAKVDGAARDPSFVPSAHGWQDLGNGRAGLAVSMELFNCVMPASAMAGEASSTAMVSAMQAREFLDRMERQVGAYRKGIEFPDGGRPKSKAFRPEMVRWRFPTASEARILKASSPKPWLEGDPDPANHNPFERRALEIVIEEKNDGR